jgi:pimeloyl-ACP methyl ester carboxylesterase
MSKPVLLFLPGLLCDPRVFAAQHEALRNRADIVVADFMEGASMADFAGRALAAVPGEGPVALAGFSMGGYVAFEILRRAPQRVVKLALLDTQARPDSEESLKRRRGFLELAQKGKFKGVTPSLMPSLVHKDRLGDAALTGAIVEMAMVVGKDGFVRQQTAIMGRPNSRPMLPSIRVPTLVLCGRDDVPTPLAAAEEMAAAIPGATLTVVDGCGHMAPMEKPDAVTAALAQWLDR